MSVSRIARRISSPKKAITTVAMAAATAGLVLTAAPAQAATTNSPAQAKAIAHKMIPNASQYAAFSKIVATMPAAEGPAVRGPRRLP